MLWLCIHFPDLPLAALHVPPASAVAVYTQSGQQRFVLSASEAALAQAVRSGQKVTAASTLCPSLRLVERNPAAEKNLLEQLCALACELGSEVSADVERRRLWCEISRSQNYFGGLAPLMQRARQLFFAHISAADFGIAPTLEAAALACDLHLLPILAPADIRSRLAAVPMAALALTEEIRRGLRGAGIRRLDQLSALPRDGLRRRFGAGLLDYLDRLLGDAADVRRRYQPPAIYQRKLEFAGAVETQEGLLFALKRLLAEFAAYLRARDSAVQNFHLHCHHESQELSHFTLGLSAPARAAEHLLTVVRERMAGWQLPAPVTALTLAAEQFCALQNTQADFFGAVQRDAAWTAVLDRLRARLGADALRWLRIEDSHLPERVAASGGNSGSIEADSLPPRPIWLLREPRQLAELPQLLSPPERIETAWWDTSDVRRDYYLAELDGSRLWIFREAASREWWLHGLWA
ncbi:MAG: Y-family DNA polymerase [Nevskiales bacterium]